MPEGHYIAYYRDSTARQGQSGLGQEAQRQAVEAFTNGNGCGEYHEVESGKRHENRPELEMALAECRRHKATLVITKLDRLARNVHFISGRMESGVDFVAADMPDANRLTVHILAAMAAANVLPIIHAIRAAGVTTLSGIADALNARGIKTSRGGQWYPATVKNVLRREVRLQQAESRAA